MKYKKKAEALIFVTSAKIKGHLYVLQDYGLYRIEMNTKECMHRSCALVGWHSVMLSLAPVSISTLDKGVVRFYVGESGAIWNYTKKVMRLLKFRRSSYGKVLAYKIRQSQSRPPGIRMPVMN